MSEKFYEAIKRRFDNTASLVPSPFAKLYTGMPDEPEDTPWPFCVLVPDTETKTGGVFGGNKFRQATVRFHVVTRLLGTLGGYDQKIADAFDGAETALSDDVELVKAGIHVTRFEKTGGRHEEGDFAWESIQEYEAAYYEDP